MELFAGAGGLALGLHNDSWSFVGSRGSQYKQIGNAVPVNLAYHIGKSLIEMLESIYSQNILK